MADAAFVVHCSQLATSSQVLVAHEISTEELLSDPPDLAGFWIQRNGKCHLGEYPSLSLMFPVALVRFPCSDQHAV